MFRYWSGWRIFALWVAWPILASLVSISVLLGPDAWRLPAAGEFHRDFVVSGVNLAKLGAVVLLVPTVVTLIWTLARRGRDSDGPAA